METKEKYYYSVIADGFGPKHFHFWKDAKKCYDEIKQSHSAPELYRINQTPTGNGKWKKL